MESSVRSFQAANTFSDLLSSIAFVGEFVQLFY